MREKFRSRKTSRASLEKSKRSSKHCALRRHVYNNWFKLRSRAMNKLRYRAIKKHLKQCKLQINDKYCLISVLMFTKYSSSGKKLNIYWIKWSMKYCARWKWLCIQMRNIAPTNHSITQCKLTLITTKHLGQNSIPSISKWQIERASDYCSHFGICLAPSRVRIFKKKHIKWNVRYIVHFISDIRGAN